MTKWAYQRIHIEPSSLGQGNEIGAQGWEMAEQIGDYMYFKKPAGDPTPFTLKQSVTSLGTTNTPIVPAGHPEATLRRISLILSGSAPDRAVTTISLRSADLAKVYWSCVIDLAAAKQAAVIPFQELVPSYS